METTTIQRVENGAVAVTIFVGFVVTDAGWGWLLLLFLAFDLSAVGYLGGPRLGAIVYNLAHNYTGPAVLLLAGLLLGAFGLPVPFLAFLSGVWAFHVGADRALGFGLKMRDAFQHTHLGWIGRHRPEITRSSTAE